ncbi:MAG: hypothetical protein ACR2PL_17020 [Dehalococcoidia bacterium]
MPLPLLEVKAQRRTRYNCAVCGDILLAGRSHVHLRLPMLVSRGQLHLCPHCARELLDGLATAEANRAAVAAI